MPPQFIWTLFSCQITLKHITRFFCFWGVNFFYSKLVFLFFSSNYSNKNVVLRYCPSVFTNFLAESTLCYKIAATILNFSTNFSVKSHDLSLLPISITCFVLFFSSNYSNLGVAWIFSRIFWLNQHFAFACCCYTILCATLH